MARLIRVEVHNLLDQFEHKLDFPSNWDFCILYGPNGIGKTRLLEIIKAALECDIVKLGEIPFDSAVLYFDDERVLRVDSWHQDKDGSSDALFQNRIKLRLVSPDGSEITWPSENIWPVLRDIQMKQIVRGSVYQEQPGLWRDVETDEFLSTTQVVNRYKLNIADSELAVPDELVEFSNGASVQLIETQRLLQYPARRNPRQSSTHRPTERPTVLEYAKDLAQRLQAAMSENSRISQRLDRSFPRRVLSSTSSSKATDDVIRGRYSEQNELRERLAKIALLDGSADLPLPDRILSDWERRFLWTYLNDADQKLKTFQDLLNKVELLREIVNSRFLFKKMEIDRREGFRFVTDGGNDISAQRLSSGEQHELVLAYNLLFNSKPDSLVLIDEPEISLHVIWQQMFIEDIKKISELAKLRFIIATHSPQVIHRWWGNAIALGPFVNGGDTK